MHIEPVEQFSKLQNGLNQIEKRSGESADTAWTMIGTGQWKPYWVWDGEHRIGFVLLEFRQTPPGLWITGLFADRGTSGWTDRLSDILTEVAIRRGLTDPESPRIFFASPRKGWARRLVKLGATEESVIYSIGPSA